jgi:hypothetical protein
VAEALSADPLLDLTERELLVRLAAAQELTEDLPVHEAAVLLEDGI